MVLRKKYDSKSCQQDVIYERDGMFVIAWMHYGEAVISLPYRSFGYSHDELKGKVLGEWFWFRLGDREIRISSFSGGYLVYIQEMDVRTHTVIREDIVSYRMSGLPQKLLDFLAKNGEDGCEWDDEEDEFCGILRERVDGHMLTLNADGGFKSELLNAYHCLGELGTVAGQCGYPGLEDEVNGYILEVEQKWDFLGGF